MATREWVLVVDDDADLAAVLAELLESHGLKAGVAESGGEGIRLLREQPPVLCILDWFLPDGPPVALAGECRARGIPFVLSSAAEGSREWASQLGATGLLSKPFDVDDFYRIIDEARRGRPSLVT